MKIFLNNYYIVLFQIHVYSQDHTALLNHFPQEMLPQDYGGQEDTSDNLSGI